jgi:hypothetical protein
MARSVQPWGERSTRVAEHGRLRAGDKGAKGQPQKRSTWRATSIDKEACEEIARIYHGEVTPWRPADGRMQWQVATTSTFLRVVLPPDCLTGPNYEAWGNGICNRRCDGLVCETPMAGPDGHEYVESPCICKEDGLLACKPSLRLNVILPEIRFGGIWSLVTHSWNACDELPGMVDLIDGLRTSHGMAQAELHLEERTSTVITTKGPRKNRYMVPRLVVPASADALAAGAGSFGSLTSGEERRAIPVETVAYPEDFERGPSIEDPLGEASGEGPSPIEVGPLDPLITEPKPAPPSPDDIEDAEVVADPADLLARVDRMAHRDAADDRGPALRQKIALTLKDAGHPDDDVRHALAHHISGGRTSSTRELTDAELDKALQGARAIQNGSTGVLREGDTIVFKKVKAS